MLHIILLILKIIGIVLLCILGFLLLAILCALFVPMRYRMEVCREEGEEKPPFTAYVKITWLLHLVNILVRYPAEVIVRVRIFLITIFRISEKDKGSKNENQEQKRRSKAGRKGKDREAIEEHEEQKDQENLKAKEQPESREGQEDRQSKTQEEPENEDDRDHKDDDFTPFEMGALEGELQKPSDEQETEGEENSSESGKASLAGKIRKLIEKIKGFLDKIKQAVDKIKAFFENIQYTIRNFCDKIKSTLDNIQYYREVMESDTFRRSMELCKGELGYVFRKLKPDKFEANLNLGMEDPAALGQILAVYGMLYPLIGQQVSIAGDFESEGTHIEGRLYMRGRIRAFTFLRVLIRVYMNKDIRTLIRLLKKEAV